MSRGPELVPPHDEEAERSVLGAAMLSEDALADISEALQPDDFYRPAHRAIFEVALALYAKGKPVDQVTVLDEIKRRGRGDEVGGPLYVQRLVETVEVPASAKHYAKIISDLARIRRLVSVAGEILRLAHERPDAEELTDLAESRIYQATRVGERHRPYAIGELVSEAMDQVEATTTPGTPTGFPDLDDLLGGLQPGALIMVAARPGEGKSSFVTNVARNVAVEGGRPVVLFSLEMSRLELAMRLWCAEARVSWQDVREGADDALWGRLVRAAEVFDQVPLTVVDSASVTLVEIRAQVRRMRHRGDLGLVVVDYLQLMSPHVKAESREREVAEISRGLKVLAKELEVPVVAVSQLNRDPERRKDRKPQLSDLRESGALEADSDVVLFIHRNEDNGPVELIVAKHRNGPTGSALLTFREHLMQFVSYHRGGEG